MSMLADIGLLYDVALFKARFMGMSDAAFFGELDRDSRERLGIPLPGDFAKNCRERLYREVGTRLVEIDGAEKAVAGLVAKKAVASSSTVEKLQIKLTRAGLWHHFAPHIYGADHVAQAKPAPDLFLHAAAGLGVRASACLVIEDSVNGVRAGLAAGMRVWGFGGGGHMDAAARERLADAGAERVVANWREAESLFLAL